MDLCREVLKILKKKTLILGQEDLEIFLNNDFYFGSLD